MQYTTNIKYTDILYPHEVTDPSIARAVFAAPPRPYLILISTKPLKPTFLVCIKTPMTGFCYQSITELNPGSELKVDSPTVCQ